LYGIAFAYIGGINLANRTSSNNTILVEIRDLLRVISEEQQQLLSDINDLREEQQKLHEEIKTSNYVLGNIALRSEIVN
jgi:hypothetical protein